MLFQKHWAYFCPLYHVVLLNRQCTGVGIIYLFEVRVRGLGPVQYHSLLLLLNYHCTFRVRIRVSVELG